MFSPHPQPWLYSTPCSLFTSRSLCFALLLHLAASFKATGLILLPPRWLCPASILCRSHIQPPWVSHHLVLFACSWLSALSARNPNRYVKAEHLCLQVGCSGSGHWTPLVAPGILKNSTESCQKSLLLQIPSLISSDTPFGVLIWGEGRAMWILEDQRVRTFSML